MKQFRFVLFLPIAISACQSATTTPLDIDNFKLPARSKYACDSGEQIAVVNNGASVTLTKPDGSSVELPAVEPGSRSRFGAGIAAIVFDGSGALYMETGKTPLECKR